jgi:hypothetical protein
MVDAENGEELALVLDDHAGAKLRCFNAAHNLPKVISNFGNSGGPGSWPHPE